jgi:hypothetical protein
MAAVDPQGTETYWIDGTSFEGIRDQATDTGTEKYWFEGKSAVDLFPLNNGDTGKFFLMFE